MSAFKHLVLVGLSAVILAACSSNPSQTTSSASTDSGVSDATTPAVTTVRAGAGDTGVSDATTSSVSLDNVIYFGFDQSSISAEGQALLSQHAARLRGGSSLIRLEGHGDERGTREYNIALGERRAKAVADFLVLQGISPSRVETVSYGEERPAVSGSGESVWSKNRRVVIN